jgi:serpin B
MATRYSYIGICQRDARGRLLAIWRATREARLRQDAPMRRLLLMLLAALLVAPAGAAVGAPAAKPRAVKPTPRAERIAVVRGETDFAFDLYRRLARSGAPNVVFSPHGAATALSMASAGARGRMRAQMARVLHHPLPPGRLHPALGALGRDLNAAGAGGEGRPVLATANALWVAPGYPVLPRFIGLLARDYGAPPAALDFSGDPIGARDAVNAWGAEQTRGMIPKVLGDAPPDRLTRLLLANAVYLKADWAAPFPAAATVPGAFTTLAGAAIEVPMMRKLAPRRYARLPELEAVELPYVGGRLSMVALLPAPGGLAALERRLDEPTLRRVLRAMALRGVDLSMPRFRLDASMDLIPPLKALGMRDAFDGRRADFGGITAEQVAVKLVRQAAFVIVDEKGTEAGAVTAVGIGPTSVPVTDVRLALDRPFLFLIRDRATGTVLFIGRVGDPLAD